jgi:hypothetical protein
MKVSPSNFQGGRKLVSGLDFFRSSNPSYILAGALAEAMHCHWPLGILVQVSTQRS